MNAAEIREDFAQLMHRHGILHGAIIFGDNHHLHLCAASLAEIEPAAIQPLHEAARDAIDDFLNEHALRLKERISKAVRKRKAELLAKQKGRNQ